jgi:hypothetical protein
VGDAADVSRVAPHDAELASPAQDYVLAQGMRETRGALERWLAAPGPVLGGWFAGAMLVALGLLGATWLVATQATRDTTFVWLAGLTSAVDVQDYARIVGANLIVLALHATACVAGFIAGNSMPVAASRMSGVRRFVHEKAGQLAIWWVVAVITFSLLTQAYALGLDASNLAAGLEIDPSVLILTVLPHALPELVAIFLPLAAWLIASRRDEWGDLLAATFVTVAIAVPMLLASALIELYVWPELLERASPVV